MKLNYNLDFKCKTRQTDVTQDEFFMMAAFISKFDIKNYLEVGVWHGATLYSMVNLFKLNGVDLDAWGYDCFDEGADPKVLNSHTSGWPSKKMVQELFHEFNNVTLATGDVSNIHNVLSNQKFDFVFHDANHTKDAIIGDLLVLKNILNDNAYISVHNSAFDEPWRNFFGKTAINYLVENNHYKFIATANTATLLQKINE